MECYCTLVTSDSFVIGAVALILSILRYADKEDQRDILVIHLSSLSKASLFTLKRLKRVKLKEVEKIEGPDDVTRQVQSWSDFTKLRIWEQIEYDKLLYLDADTMLFDSIQELFSRDLGKFGFAAAPDVYPPDKFNAGVLLIRPDKELFHRLIHALPTLSSYDGGDTGFLNAFFPTWYESSSNNRLPFTYNAQRTLHWITFKNQPGYWNSIGPKKIIHFSSSPKPWLDPEKKGDLELLWWTSYTESLGMKF